MTTRKCPSCDTVNRVGAKFCRNCGASIPEQDQDSHEEDDRGKRCSHCNTINRSSANHCVQCGASFLSDQEKPGVRASRPSKKPSKKSAVLIGGLVVVLCVCFFGMIAVFFFQGDILHTEPNIKVSEVVVYSDVELPLLSHLSFESGRNTPIEAIDFYGAKTNEGVFLEGASVEMEGILQPWQFQFDAMDETIKVMLPDGSAYHVGFTEDHFAVIEYLTSEGETGIERIALSQEQVEALESTPWPIRKSESRNPDIHRVSDHSTQRKLIGSLDSAYNNSELARLSSQNFSIKFYVDGILVRPDGIKVEVVDCRGVPCKDSLTNYFDEGVLLRTIHKTTLAYPNNPPVSIIQECESSRWWEDAGISLTGLAISVLGALHFDAPMVVGGIAIMSIGTGLISTARAINAPPCSQIAQWEVALEEFGALTSDIQICVSHPHIQFSRPCQSILTHPFPVTKRYTEYYVFDESSNYSMIFDGTCSSEANKSNLSPCEGEISSEWLPEHNSLCDYLPSGGRKDYEDQVYCGETYGCSGGRCSNDGSAPGEITISIGLGTEDYSEYFCERDPTLQYNGDRYILMQAENFGNCAWSYRNGYNGVPDANGFEGWGIDIFYQKYKVQIHTHDKYPTNQTWIYDAARKIVDEIVYFNPEEH